MSCIKTGCHIRIAPYNTWAYGDLFQEGDVYYARIVQESPTPIVPYSHGTVIDFSNWWDRDNPGSRPSTLITKPGGFLGFDYDGKNISEEIE